MGLSSSLDSTGSSNGSNVRNLHALIKKIIAVFLSFIVLYTSTSTAYAAQDYEWRYKARILLAELKETGDRLSAQYPEMRKHELKYRIIKAEPEVVVSRLTEAEVNSRAFRSTIVPKSNDLGKVMRKRIFAGAVVPLAGALAVEQLLTGIGWVMDPAAQTIWRPGDEMPPDIWLYQNPDTLAYGSLQDACQGYISKMNKDAPTGMSFSLTGCIRMNPDVTQPTSATIKFQRNYNGAVTNHQVNAGFPYKRNTTEPQKEYLSDTDLGEAMKGKATGGNHMPATTDIATGIKEAGTPIPEDGDNPVADDAIANEQPETAQDRENDNTTFSTTETTTNSTTDPTTGDVTKTTTTTTTKTDPKTGEKTKTETTETTVTKPDGSSKTTTTGAVAKTVLPEFCTWAKVVCDHIKWIQEDPKPDPPEQPDHDEIGEGMPSNPTINFGGTCPPSVPFTFEFPFRTFTWNFEWTNLCNALVQIRPYVIGISNLMAVFILLNARKEIT